MRCIFCLKESQASEEHVFPSAIGGLIKTDRVCSNCNSLLGSRVDASLSDDPLIRARRAQLSLSGNSGRTPKVYDMLLGVHGLEDNPKQRVQVTFDEAGQQLDVKLLHNSSEVILPDGGFARQVIIDQRDAHELPKIIRRERKRLGLPELTGKDLSDALELAKASLTSKEDPVFVVKMMIDFGAISRAIAKIAYELAFLWLGEDYLIDPRAEKLRSAILNGQPWPLDGVIAGIVDPNADSMFDHWPASESTHIAFVSMLGEGLVIAIRIFGLYHAVVRVTDDSRSYLSGANVDKKLRFLEIDAAIRSVRDTTLIEEFQRLARLAVEAARTSQS